MADSSKTEQATPRHRQEARKRGQVTRSRELSGALSMSAVAGVIFLMGRESVPHWTHFFRATLDLASTDAITPNGPLLFWTSVEVVRWVFPIVLSALAVSVVVGLAQGGFVFAPEALAFQFERLSPASKLGQIFSPAGLSNILKSLLPFGAIAWIGAQAIRMHWNEILGSSYVDSRQFTSLICRILIELFWKSALVLLLWAGMDYLLLWWKSEGDLKMSRQDLRDELKQTEGNPQSKARIRRIQRQSRRRQMLKAAETATVVITNPTHYAVALRYESNMSAPTVVAKGLDNLAAKIKEVAWKFDIPVMENRPLAQALYKSVEVGDPIPSALYHAVAEILVLIFKAQAEVKNRQARRNNAAAAQRTPVRTQ
ncbi:MAG TPA: EscU/YscU/HrcU family type III secretion system export apparatus switch protein [Terracidiphilus sp.]|jgi:flagellar biosynthetic protein FlhB|nr:EscU/YscU/HrcU family type III secretion system export apparatus switch protein [Terracidiphilus sp.]